MITGNYVQQLLGITNSAVFLPKGTSNTICKLLLIKAGIKQNIDKKKPGLAGSAGCLCTNTDLLQGQDVERETSFFEHSLKLSDLHPSVLCTLTCSPPLWRSKHTSFSKVLGGLHFDRAAKLKHIFKAFLLRLLCTINEDDAGREPQLLVSVLTQTLKRSNREKNT